MQKRHNDFKSTESAPNSGTTIFKKAAFLRSAASVFKAVPKHSKRFQSAEKSAVVAALYRRFYEITRPETIVGSLHSTVKRAL